MSHWNVYAPEILPVRSQMLLAAKISALGFHAHREVWVLLLPHVNGWVLFVAEYARDSCQPCDSRFRAATSKVLKFWSALGSLTNIVVANCRPRSAVG